jgi:PadR family transcriptional regulator AphA
MSLRNTLLGFLYLGPMTGYELKKYMDNSTQLFWYAALSQIYPALKKLESEGMIRSELQPQEGKPDKRIYTITEAGRTAWLAWLAEPVEELPAKKQPDLLKLFFSGVLDKETILDHLHRQLDLHRAQLVHYERETKAYVAQIIAETGLAREGMMWEQVRQFGEASERASIRWLEETIETIEKEL